MNRKIWTDDEIKEIVERKHSFIGSRKEFFQQEKLTPSRFYQLQKRLEAKQHSHKQIDGFIEVIPSRSSQIEIHFNGIKVLASQTVSIEYLSTLIRVLSVRS